MELVYVDGKIRVFINLNVVGMGVKFKGLYNVFFYRFLSDFSILV